MRLAARVVASLAAPTLTLTLLVGGGASAATPAPAPGTAGPPAAAAERPAPLVFGHRGASGYRPEHTLASYRLAMQMGADFVEPDLVATKDRVLVARHENEIAGTTDVEEHPEFAARKTKKVIDGVEFEGWFTEDFTLAELKTLRAEERIPARRQENTIYNGRYQVPTFDEVIDLVQAESKRIGRTVGIAPETKHPTYFDGIGLSLEEPLVNDLNEAGLFGRRAPVVIQSFETANLRQLRRMTRIPLVQLIAGSGAPYDLVAAGSQQTYADLITDAGLRRIDRYADWIGPDKNRIVPRDAQGALLDPTDLVDRAHAAGLKVVPYTFRNENEFLPTDFRSSADPSAYGDAFAEYELFYGLGVDGVFSDNPDTAVEAREGEWAPVQLQLLALNDFHGALEPPAGSGGLVDGVPAGGAEYLATQIARLTAAAGPRADTITVAAGDLIGASPLLSAAFHDEPTIESLGLAGLDYASVGNHEFDEGAAELLRIQNGGCHPTDGCADGTPFEGAAFQYLSANAFVSETGEPLLAPYAVDWVDGVKVGFIGMTLKGTADIVSQQGIAGLEFADEVETANRYAAELQDQGVEAIVVLLHEGGTQAAGGGINECRKLSGPIVEIAKGMSDAIDAVVSGHTHQAYNCEIDGKLVTSAGFNGRLVTDIDLTLDRRSGDVRTARAANVVVTRDVAADAEQTALIGRYRAALGPIAGQQVGEVATDVVRAQETLFEADGQPVRGESPLGNLIADAQLAATDDEQGAVAAFMNPGGVRADLLAGSVTYEEAFTVQPFANNLVTLDLTGEQLQCLLEQQFAVGRVLASSSSVAYLVDPAGTSAPAADPCAGTRVVDASLTLAGVAVDPTRTYRVTVNSFLAGGGDGFTTLLQGTNAVTGMIDLDAFIAYLGATSPVPAPSLDRIRTTGEAGAGAAAA